MSQKGHRPWNVGAADIEVKFPSARDSRLPSIYVMEDHPLHKGRGKAYYFIHDGSREASEKTYRMEVDDLKIPQGPKEDAIALGLLELRPGDATFSRMSSAPASGTEDMIVVWVTGGDIYSKFLKMNALSVRNTVLGPREQRSRGHATRDLDTGEMVGGTTWERSLDGKFNPQRGRCYPFGCTHQKQRSLYSPCAAGKLSVADEATLRMRAELTDVVTEMAMISLSQGPTSVVEAIKLNHELFNTPRVGSNSNFAFTSNQLNLAHIREWNSSETLADSMGKKFGAAHIDQLDSPGHFTNMLALSDLPQNCDPGRFFIVYPGVFCTLENFVAVNFSGLRVHGGSPPIATKETTEYEMEWSARFIGVSYAKTGPTSNDRKMPLMQIESDKILSVTPEMLRPGPFALEKTFDSSNFITEGPTMMTPSAIMEFLARCFLLLILAMISRLPPTLGVKLDSDAFLGAFSYLDEKGDRKSVGKWLNGPGWRPRTTCPPDKPRAVVENVTVPAAPEMPELYAQEDYLAQKRLVWKEHENRCGAHIPSAVCCVAGIKPLEGWTEGDPLEKMKPLLFNKGKNKQSEQGESSNEETPVSDAPKKKKRKNKAHKKKSNLNTKTNKQDVQPSSTNATARRSNMPNPTDASQSSERTLRSRSSLNNNATFRMVAPANSKGHTDKAPSSSRRRLIPIVLIDTRKSNGQHLRQESPMEASYQDGQGESSEASSEQGDDELSSGDESSPYKCRSPTLTSLNARYTASPDPYINVHGPPPDLPHINGPPVPLSSLFGTGDSDFNLGAETVWPNPAAAQSSRVDDEQLSTPSASSTEWDALESMLNGPCYDYADASTDGRVLDGSHSRAHTNPRKRTRSYTGQEDGSSLKGYSGEAFDDASHASKRRYAGFDQVWTSTAYKKLEIHMIDCSPANPVTPQHRLTIEDVVTTPLLGGGNLYSRVGISREQASPDADKEENRNLRDLPKYLRAITSKVVHAELQSLRNDVISLAAFRSSFDVAKTVDALANFQNSVVIEPLDVSSVASVQMAWSSMNVLNQYEKSNSIRLRKHRACIMLSSSAAWNWLTVVIPSAISNLVKRETCECRWLSDLLTDIHRAVVGREKGKKFFPYNFGLHLNPVRAAMIDFHDYQMPGERDYDGWIRLYSSVATEIIEVWLNFPETGDALWQGMFALNIVQTVGPEFLLLNVVWDCYRNADYSLIQNTYLPEELDRSQYPLLSLASELRANVSKISQLVNDYVEGRLYRYMDLESSGGMSIDYASEGMVSLYEEHALEFKHFILDCFKVVFRGEAISNRKLAHKLVTDADKFSPFRELAPTRLNLLKPSGPFSPTALQTPHGLFSAVVARAVTFGTVFARTGRTLFTSPEDFWQAVHSCPGTEKMSGYCDKTAYGGFNPQRSSDMVGTYWKKVVEDRWAGLDAVNPVPFVETRSFFHPPPNEARRFPQLGALGSYLLTVDYVYTGLVLPPTLEQLAGIVCDLDKGPARALEHLGLVSRLDKDTSTPALEAKRREQFIVAFKIADQMVKDSIPQEYHKEAGVDMFVTEHSLCKYVRARNRCGYSLSAQ